MPKETDIRGHDLVVGATVVFNYSGSLDIGTITKAEYSKTRKRWSGKSYTYAVDYEVKSHTRPSDKPSKVKNSRSLLVIEE